MRGRVSVITGATRGIGHATGLALARVGAEVVLVGRDPLRTAAVRDAIRRDTGNDLIEAVTADLASLASVRRAAERIAERWAAIHVLINNAGVNSARLEMTPDGHELTFAVNHLAPFLLTNLLVPQLRAGAPARVINVSSVFERLGRIDFDDLNGRRRSYDATRAYTQSKLANVLFTYELADRLAGSGVTVNCVFPGLVASDLMRQHWWFTAPLLRSIWRGVLLTPEQGARAAVHVASSPEVSAVTGRCFGRNGRQVTSSRRSHESDLRRRLWRVSAEMTGLASDEAGPLSAR